MAVSSLVAASSGLTSSQTISAVQEAMSSLTLRQTITSTGAITIPSTVTQVFAVLAGGGGPGAGNGSGSYQGGGGGAGGISYGWILPPSYVFIGSGGSAPSSMGNPSVCGPLISGGGGTGTNSYSQRNLYSTYLRGRSTTNATEGNFIANNGARGGTFNSGSINFTDDRGMNYSYVIIQEGSSTLRKEYFNIPGVTYGIGSHGFGAGVTPISWGYSGGGGGGNATGGTATNGESGLIGGGGGPGMQGGNSFRFTTTSGGGCGIAGASTDRHGGLGGGGGQGINSGTPGGNGGSGALLLFY